MQSLSNIKFALLISMIEASDWGLFAPPSASAWTSLQRQKVPPMIKGLVLDKQCIKKKILLFEKGT